MNKTQTKISRSYVLIISRSESETVWNSFYFLVYIFIRKCWSYCFSTVWLLIQLVLKVQYYLDQFWTEILKRCFLKYPETSFLSFLMFYWSNNYIIVWKRGSIFCTSSLPSAQVFGLHKESHIQGVTVPTQLVSWAVVLQAEAVGLPHPLLASPVLLIGARWDDGFPPPLSAQRFGAWTEE